MIFYRIVSDLSVILSNLDRALPLIRVISYVCGIFPLDSRKNARVFDVYVGVAMLFRSKQISHIRCRHLS